MSQELLIFIAIGFFAQIIDGALGMAFGVICTSALLSLGLPPAAASALTHVTEIFTTAASGASHAHQRNVDWKLVARLAPAGMIGGAIGAYLLSSIDASFMEPLVSLYLIGFGLYILYKAFRQFRPRQVSDKLVPGIGLGGGLLDAMGGGGWGPIVTTSLVGRGHDPKKVIGSANLSEFMVTLTISLTFVLTLGWTQFNAAIGLIIGGVLAAPFGALLVKRLPLRPLMVAVAVVIIGTSVYRFFGG